MRTKIETGFIPSIVEIHGKKYFYNHYVMTGLALPSDLEHTCWFCSHAHFVNKLRPHHIYFYYQKRRGVYKYFAYALRLRGYKRGPNSLGSSVLITLKSVTLISTHYQNSTTFVLVHMKVREGQVEFPNITNNDTTTYNLL